MIASIALVALCAATLHLRILDEDGHPVAARVRLLDAMDRAQPVATEQTPQPVLIHPRFPELGIAVPGEVKIRLPDGKSKIRVERGTEYRPVEIDAVDGTRVVRLRRWIHMARRGWWSGDTHVHRKPEEAALLMDAADLHFAPVITKWNNNSNLESWPAQPVFSAGDRAYSVDNSEDERNWGAALFFGLKTPIALYPYKSEWPPPTATWSEVRRRGGFIDQEKIIWWAAPVIAALIPPDTIGVALNHFLEEGMLETEAWGRPRDQAKYPGQAGFARYIFDLYAMYLSAGFRIPASAGSANGVLKNPIGYNRSYVSLGKRFSYDAWLAGQKAGKNFVTNGPMLFVTVDGDRVKLEALSSGELERAEIVVDGAIAETFRPGADRSHIRASARVKTRPGGWLAVRCFEKNSSTVRFAHTSPVFFGSSATRSPEALAAMREWIDVYVERVRTLQLTEEQRQEWLAMCRKAREFYQ